MAGTDRGGSALAPPLLNSIQRGTVDYTYKGIPTLKNPFDWALYPRLIWETRPRTIIEIGSAYGGSALWLADTMRTFDLAGHVHSFDRNPVTSIVDPAITFHRANAERLGETVSADFMRGLARPLMVIEDASHFKEISLAVLNFFRQWLEPGEYIIIEDGIVNELGMSERFRGGPRAAIEVFLSENPNYEIDKRYCDWFGPNVTYAVNGYLRRRI